MRFKEEAKPSEGREVMAWLPQWEAKEISSPSCRHPTPSALHCPYQSCKDEPLRRSPIKNIHLLEGERSSVIIRKRWDYFAKWWNMWGNLPGDKMETLGERRVPKKHFHAAWKAWWWSKGWDILAINTGTCDVFSWQWESKLKNGCRQHSLLQIT